MAHTALHISPTPLPAGQPAPQAAAGEPRRTAAPQEAERWLEQVVPLDWLAAMANLLDFGLVLLKPDQSMVFANAAAHRLADELPGVCSVNPAFSFVQPGDRLRLRVALGKAALGVGSSLRVGGDGGLPVRVLPVRAPHGELPQWAWLALGRPVRAGAAALDHVAHSFGLTPSERGVLAQLCQGHAPARVARDNGVALCTVRSQIAAVRAKTGAANIPHLLQQVAQVPPVTGFCTHVA